MPTGYQLLPFPSRHKSEGDDSPNLEAQQENEPISGIECLFRFYRSVLGRDFSTRVYDYLGQSFRAGKQNFIWVGTKGFSKLCIALVVPFRVQKTPFTKLLFVHCFICIVRNC